MEHTPEQLRATIADLDLGQEILVGLHTGAAVEGLFRGFDDPALAVGVVTFDEDDDGETVRSEDARQVDLRAIATSPRPSSIAAPSQLRRPSPCIWACSTQVQRKPARGAKKVD
jgi:hypothetical protein